MKARVRSSTRRVGFSRPAHRGSTAQMASKLFHEPQSSRAQFTSNSTFNPSVAVPSTRTGRLKPTLRVLGRLRWVLVAFTILFSHGEAFADGGTVRLVEECDGYRLSVFTSPTPCRVGTVDVSVMVQVARTGRVLLDSRVAVNVAPRTHPTSVRRYQATASAATNKLFQAALVEIPAEGIWNIEVQVEGLHGPAQVQCEMDVAPPLPRWEALWKWIAWPGVVIALFALRTCVQPDRRRTPAVCRSKP